MTHSQAFVRDLSKRELISRLTNALDRGARCEAEILALLSEVDARKVYAEVGYASMFSYCTGALHLSESAAYARIGVARAARKFPVLLEQVRERGIHLAGLRLLVPHLTSENHLELLGEARHKTKDEIAALLADRTPKPDVLASIRKLPVGRQGSRPQAPEAVSINPPPRPRPEPLGMGRFKVQFTADPELHGKLREAQALLRHQIPDGDPAKIIDKALTLLLADTKKKKFAHTSRPRVSKPERENPSRHVPAEIRREIVTRDGARCSYTSPDGRQCGSCDFLEFDHQKPWARFQRHDGGEMRLLCRTHNQLTAERHYGLQHMDRRRKRSRLDPDPVACQGCESLMSAK